MEVEALPQDKCQDIGQYVPMLVVKRMFGQLTNAAQQAGLVESI